MGEAASSRTSTTLDRAGRARHAARAASRSTARRSCPSTSRAPSAREGWSSRCPPRAPPATTPSGSRADLIRARTRRRRRHGRRGDSSRSSSSAASFASPRWRRDECQPFDLEPARVCILGEGAGLLVLEIRGARGAPRRDAARRSRRLRPLVRRVPHHASAPRSDGQHHGDAPARSSAPGIGPGDVDFVNAHGTGTRANDVAEAKVMRDVFGDRRVPISSMKSMLGHCMGAASALEAIACVMTLETGIYPPTSATRRPIPSATSTSSPTWPARGKARHRAQQLARVRRLQRRRRASRKPGRPPAAPRTSPKSRRARERVKPRAVTGLGIVSRPRHRSRSCSSTRSRIRSSDRRAV